MATTQYTCVEGDRWDTIAFKAYGDAADFQGIIAANPSVPITDELTAGVRLNIPIKETPNETTQNELLPPWKRL